MSETVERGRGGRKPRVLGTPSLVRLSIRLTVDERRDLESVAQENNICLAEVLREAVNEFVHDYRERDLFNGVKSKVRA
jgi:hypothetical protein